MFGDSEKSGVLEGLSPLTFFSKSESLTESFKSVVFPKLTFYISRILNKSLYIMTDMDIWMKNFKTSFGSLGYCNK